MNEEILFPSNGIKVLTVKDLELCPYCGSLAVLLTNNRDLYIAKCTICDAFVPRQFLSDLRVVPFKTAEDAIKAWNKRRRSRRQEYDKELHFAKGNKWRDAIVENIQSAGCWTNSKRIAKELDVTPQMVRKHLGEIVKNYPEVRTAKDGNMVLYKWEE